MVALGSDPARAVSRENDLRGHVGLGLAVAWVLVHLWHASPLPYALQRATGLVLHGNTSQERGLLVGFALCLAFVLFEPRRFKLPGWMDAVLAVLAAVAGSSVFWNYNNINANYSDPDGLSLAMAAVGLAMLAWAAVRVFGWFGVALLAFVTAMQLMPLVTGYWRLIHLRSPVDFLHHHWHSAESVFGLYLGALGLTGFLFVIFGVGLDVLGFGRPIAGRMLRPLPQDADSASLASDHRGARNLCALAVLFYAAIPRLPDDLSAELPYDATYAWVWNLVGPLLVGIALYLAFLAVARWPWRSKSDAARKRRMSLGAGGMLVGVALILDFVLIITYVGIVIAFGDLFLETPRHITPLIWLGLAIAASVLLMTGALYGPVSQQRVWLATAALLPIGLLFWLMAVERYSPGFSAFYAILLLLLVMAEHGVVMVRRNGLSSAALFTEFARGAVPPLCHGTARIMVRVAILVALLSMLMPWGPHYIWYWVFETP